MKKIISMAAMLFISVIAFAQKGYTDHSGNKPGTYNPADSKLASGRQGSNDNQISDSRDAMHNQGDMHSNRMHRSRMHHHATIGYGTRRSRHYTIKHKYTHHYSSTQ